MADTLTIFAEITPKPEHFSDAKQAIKGIIGQTRAETGCRVFNLFEAPNQATLYLFEEWDDQAAFDLHHAKPYTLAVFKAYENWLAQPPRILPLHGLS